jgi:hypothetical protein
MTEPQESPRTLRAITTLMRERFSPESDAWQNFVAECQMRFRTPSVLGENRIVPDSIWDYWLVVATGDSCDYDADGARTTKT